MELQQKEMISFSIKIVIFSLNEIRFHAIHQIPFFFLLIGTRMCFGAVHREFFRTPILRRFLAGCLAPTEGTFSYQQITAHRYVLVMHYLVTRPSFEHQRF